jgi:hypothetical protein
MATFTELILFGGFLRVQSYHLFLAKKILHTESAMLGLSTHMAMRLNTSVFLCSLKVAVIAI